MLEVPGREGVWQRCAGLYRPMGGALRGVRCRSRRVHRRRSVGRLPVALVREGQGQPPVELHSGDAVEFKNGKIVRLIVGYPDAASALEAMKKRPRIEAANSPVR
jgi:hypothetical protein